MKSPDSLSFCAKRYLAVACRTDPPGTAAGTYPLTVTGTFQSSSGSTFTEKVSFDLVVQ